jgi:hypothetical protein
MGTPDSILSLIAATSIAAGQNASVGNVKTAPAWGRRGRQTSGGRFTPQMGGLGWGSGE